MLVKQKQTVLMLVAPILLMVLSISLLTLISIFSLAVVFFGGIAKNS